MVDASRAPAIPAPKGLSERIAYVARSSSPKCVANCFFSQPKAQPKSAAASKAGAATTTGAASRGARGGRGKGRGGRGGRSARPAKKTAEELDSEMADYWDNGAAAPAETGAPVAAAQPAAAGDAMDDEILVSHSFREPLIRLSLTADNSDRFPTQCNAYNSYHKYGT